MVDVGYAWDDADRALAVIETWADYDVFFVETPLWIGRPRGLSPARRALAHPRSPPANGWRRASSSSTSWIAAASTSCSPTSAASAGSPRRAACATWRPQRGLLVVPHGWKTGHHDRGDRAAGGDHAALPFFEFVPQEVAECPLRRELTRDELTLRPTARSPLPSRPGLGVELDRDALARFTEAGRRRAP